MQNSRLAQGGCDLPPSPDTVEPTKTDAQQRAMHDQSEWVSELWQASPLCQNPKNYPMIFVDSTVCTYHFMNFSKGLRNAKPISAAGMRKSASSPS